MTRDERIDEAAKRIADEAYLWVVWSRKNDRARTPQSKSGSMDFMKKSQKEFQSALSRLVAIAKETT